MPVNPELWRQGHKNQEFKSTLGYIGRSMSVLVVTRPCFENTVQETGELVQAVKNSGRSSRQPWFDPNNYNYIAAHKHL